MLFTDSLNLCSVGRFVETGFLSWTPESGRVSVDISEPVLTEAPIAGRLSLFLSCTNHRF